MVNFGIIIIIVAIVISIAIAMFFYIDYQPNFKHVTAGEPVQVGPVQYEIEYIGQFKGSETTKPEHEFFQIQITAENVSSEPTRMSGGQFHIIDEEDKKHQPIFGNFSNSDLLNVQLEPNEKNTWFTQFDVPFDENAQYRIGVLPSKSQSSTDIGMICVLNCN